MYGLLFVTGGAAFCGGKAAPLFYVLFLYSISEYESNSSAISDTPHIHNAKLSFVVVQDSPFPSVNAKYNRRFVQDSPFFSCKCKIYPQVCAEFAFFSCKCKIYPQVCAGSALFSCKYKIYPQICVGFTFFFCKCKISAPDGTSRSQYCKILSHLPPDSPFTLPQNLSAALKHKPSLSAFLPAINHIP